MPCTSVHHFRCAYLHTRLPGNIQNAPGKEGARLSTQTVIFKQILNFFHDLHQNRCFFTIILLFPAMVPRCMLLTDPCGTL